MSAKNGYITNLLRTAGRPHLRPESRERIRLAVVASFADVIRNADERYKYQTAEFTFFSPSIMIPVIIAIILVVAGAGTVIASDAAKPGDALFGVDKALEQTRLDFTISRTAKAEYLANIAQEREKERAQLEAEGKSQESASADVEVGQALDTAKQTIDEVRTKQEQEGDSHAVDTLTKVEDKLLELQQQHEERAQEHIQIEVKITGGTAKVEVRSAGLDATFTLATTDVEQIIAQIVQRTGLTDSQVRASIKIENEDQGDSQSDSNAGENENKNVNEHKDENSNSKNDVNQSTNTSLNINASAPDGSRGTDASNENRDTNTNTEGSGQDNSGD